MALAIKQCVSCRVTSGLQNHGGQELGERKEPALTSMVLQQIPRQRREKGKSRSTGPRAHTSAGPGDLDHTHEGGCYMEMLSTGLSRRPMRQDVLKGLSKHLLRSSWCVSTTRGAPDGSEYVRVDYVRG